MKKILPLILITLLLLSCAACSHPIVYGEEEAVHNWLTQRTQGYTAVKSTSRMMLYNVDDHFSLQFNTGSNGYPQLKIEDQMKYIVATENSILSLYDGETLFTQSTHQNTVFDPYRNAYTPSMKVYMKDATHFRVFLYLYGAVTDFYPIPLLLTVEQYEAMLPIVNAYTKEQEEIAIEEMMPAFNYTQEFMNLYPAKYFSDKASNPNGGVFYQYTGEASEHMSEYRTLFKKLNLTEQDWRKSFESLGYTGQKETLQIVYFDISIGDTQITLDFHKSDSYTSDAWKALGKDFTYTFCPSLSLQEFMIVNQD